MGPGGSKGVGVEGTDAHPDLARAGVDATRGRWGGPARPFDMIEMAGAPPGGRDTLAVRAETAAGALAEQRLVATTPSHEVLEAEWGALQRERVRLDAERETLEAERRANAADRREMEELRLGLVAQASRRQRDPQARLDRLVAEGERLAHERQALEDELEWRATEVARQVESRWAPPRHPGVASVFLAAEAAELARGREELRRGWSELEAARVALEASRLAMAVDAARGLAGERLMPSPDPDGIAAK